MSSNSIKFGPLNINEKCSNFTQVASANTGDFSQYMYCTQKGDADVEYLGRVKMALSSHMGSTNFVDPANNRKVHKELMSQVRTEATHISNKSKIPIEPIQFEWN